MKVYGIVSLTGVLYAKELNLDLDKDFEWVKTFTSEGSPVILVNDLSDMEELGIEPDSIIEL